MIKGNAYSGKQTELACKAMASVNKSNNQLIIASNEAVSRFWLGEKCNSKRKSNGALEAVIDLRLKLTNWNTFKRRDKLGINKRLDGCRLLPTNGNVPLSTSVIDISGLERVGTPDNECNIDTQWNRRGIQRSPKDNLKKTKFAV